MMPSAPPKSASKADRRGVIASIPSAARRQRDRMLRPIQAPDASSPSTRPRPPIWHTTPARCEAKTDPVPIAAITPSRSCRAPFTAISASLSTRSRAKGRSAENCATLCATFAPANPMTADSWESVAPCGRARCAAARMLVRAASGSDAMFDGPPRPSPRIRPVSSQTAARQPVPPPSIPRNNAMSPRLNKDTKTIPDGKKILGRACSR